MLCKFDPILGVFYFYFNFFFVVLGAYNLKAFIISAIPDIDLPDEAFNSAKETWFLVTFDFPFYFMTTDIHGNGDRTDF